MWTLRRPQPSWRHSNAASGDAGKSVLGFVSQIADAGGGIAAFDNIIRGAATFLIAGFLQPLIVLAGAAAGALVALASAALYAGGALAGGLVAGLAQAIPVLGVVALAVSRLAAVFGAANQAQLVQQQNSYKGAQAHQTAAKSANTYANSLDSIRSAEEQLATAHRQVGVAEDALSQARRQATRDIQDMVLAEKEAELQARASSLAQSDATKALALAISTGGDVQQAQLNVASANVASQRSTLQASRASTDLATAQRQGVSGAPGVVSAQRGVSDAVRGVGDATVALARAKRGSDQAGAAADLAGDKITAATGKLDFLTAKLSPAEQKLLGIVERAQDVFRKFAETITEPIIKATGTILEKLIGVFKNPAIIGAMTGLAGEMAKQGVKFFNAFTDRKSIGIFLDFIKEAQQNLGPLTDILINVGKIFLDIAQAASPVLSALLGFFDQVTSKWVTFLDTPKGKKTLRDFFSEGTDALIAFLKLGGAIVGLFLAIAGPGGGVTNGVKLIEGATGLINKLTDSINKGGGGAKVFHDLFKAMQEILPALGPVVTSIATQLGRLFSTNGVGSVKAFAGLMANVLVPALGDFATILGGTVTVVGAFLNAHPQIERLLALAIGGLAAFGVASKAVGVFAKPIEKLLEYGTKLADTVLGIFGQQLPSWLTGRQSPDAKMKAAFDTGGTSAAEKIKRALSGEVGTGKGGKGTTATEHGGGLGQAVRIIAPIHEAMQAVRVYVVNDGLPSRPSRGSGPGGKLTKAEQEAADLAKEDGAIADAAKGGKISGFLRKIPVVGSLLDHLGPIAKAVGPVAGKLATVGLVIQAALPFITGKGGLNQHIIDAAKALDPTGWYQGLAELGENIPVVGGLFKKLAHLPSLTDLILAPVKPATPAEAAKGQDQRRGLSAFGLPPPTRAGGLVPNTGASALAPPPGAGDNFLSKIIGAQTNVGIAATRGIDVASQRVGKTITDGVKAGVKDIPKTISDPFGLGINQARARLQANSPSKVMQNLGQDMVAGLRLGIRGVANLGSDLVNSILVGAQRNWGAIRSIGAALDNWLRVGIQWRGLWAIGGDLVSSILVGAQRNWTDIRSIGAHLGDWLAAGFKDTEKTTSQLWQKIVDVISASTNQITKNLQQFDKLTETDWMSLWNLLLKIAKDDSVVLEKTFQDMRIWLSGSVDLLASHVSFQFLLDARCG